MRLLIIALLLILIPIHGFAWPEELESPSVLDRVTQEMSDGAVDAYEAQQARISVDVESKEFEACLNSDDSHACLSQVVQPYLKSVATPAAAAISSLIATTTLYPLNLIKMRAQTGMAISGGPFSGFGPYALALGVSRLDFVVYDFLRARGWNIQEAGFASALALSVPSSPLWVYHTKRSLKSVQKEGFTSQGASQTYRIQCYLKDLKADPRLAFRGQAVGMACVFPHALQFQLMEHIDGYIDTVGGNQEGNILTSYKKAVSASMARMVLIAAHPLDLLRVNRQSTGASYKEIAQGVWNKGGVLGFYRGAPVSMLKQILWTFFNRAAYDGLKEAFEGQGSGSKSSSQGKSDRQMR